MGLFDHIAVFLDEWGPFAGATRPDDPAVTNPATGLPMTGGAIDVAGNPFGADLSDHHRHDDWHHSSPWSSSMGGGHDSWRD